jgi:hypothetical protein
MPKLLAIGGPRDGYLVYIADDRQEVTFELAAPNPLDDPLVARYRRAVVAGGTEALVHDDVPAGADLDALYRAAAEKSGQSGQWPNG